MPPPPHAVELADGTTIPSKQLASWVLLLKNILYHIIFIKCFADKLTHD